MNDFFLGKFGFSPPYTAMAGIGPVWLENVLNCSDTELFSGGGGNLVHLSDVDVPFFRVLFSPISSRAEHQKKAIFWTRLSKHVKRRIC